MGDFKSKGNKGLKQLSSGADVVRSATRYRLLASATSLDLDASWNLRHDVTASSRRW
jgi:hypothetical protein